ncbi:MAG: Gfo/Idh/MocA family oxidoreductase [Pseudomonadota bacterium]
MIRVAILGAGIGAEHLAGYRALPELFEVAAICDLDAARAARIANGIRVETEAQTLIADPAIDLIDICLPPHLHVPMSLAALEAGKHVICEKPVATSLADADRLAEAEARSDGTLFPVFQYRFGRAMSQLDALRAAGLLGAPHMAALETHWARGAEYYAIPWRGTWAGEQGGAIVGHAIHAHDLLALFFGEVAQLSAQLTTRINPIETEDCAALTFTMQNGALATSSVTLGAAADTTRIRLVFEHLTATSGAMPYAPMDQPWVFQARMPSAQDKVDRVTAAAAQGHAGFAGFLEQVALCLAGAPNRAVRLTDGRRSLELITAAYASARSGGTPQSLPAAPDHPLYDGWQPK